MGFLFNLSHTPFRTRDEWPEILIWPAKVKVWSRGRSRWTMPNEWRECHLIFTSRPASGGLIGGWHRDVCIVWPGQRD